MGMISILVVDDDVARGAKLVEVLRRSGSCYHASIASSVEEAWDRLVMESFDCIFFDARLGGSDGTIPISTIGADRNRSATATIVVGSGNEREIVAAIRNGAVDYLSRSRLRPKVLRRAIERGLCVAQQQQAFHDVHARLNYLAMFDGRTGLPTRPLFCDRLNHAVLAARRNRQNLAVMVMDLVAFRSINERFGRMAGDEVLVQIGSRMKSVMRGSDTLARTRGDEFAMLLPGVESIAAATIVVEKIIAAVGAPIVVGGEQLEIGISIGIAMYPDDGPGPEALFNNADAAMYRAKREAKDFVFHGTETPPTYRSPNSVSVDRLAGGA